MKVPAQLPDTAEVKFLEDVFWRGSLKQLLMFAENGHSDDDFQQDLITEETVFAERLFFCPPSDLFCSGNCCLMCVCVACAYRR